MWSLSADPHLSSRVGGVVSDEVTELDQWASENASASIEATLASVQSVAGANPLAPKKEWQEQPPPVQGQEQTRLVQELN